MLQISVKILRLPQLVLKQTADHSIQLVKIKSVKNKSVPVSKKTAEKINDKI